MRRRLLVVASTTALALALSAGVAIADELEEYLEEAAEASYAGQQATWCSFGGKTEFSIVSVEHAGSSVMLEAAGTSQVISGGKTSANGSENGLALAKWSSVPVADRYETAQVTSEIRLGRKVSVLTIKEGSLTRAKIWFDDLTGAAMGSEVYDGDGELFRLSWMIDFDSNPRRIYEVLHDPESIYDVVVAADTSEFAADLAGYDLVDAYEGPSDSLHAFYSDGLFSFSLFTLDGSGMAEAFEEAETMDLDSGSYRWILTSSDIWTHWSGDGKTYVLVGDLPPDHLEEVLADLPHPDGESLLSRIWNGIFG